MLRTSYIAKNPRWLGSHARDKMWSGKDLKPSRAQTLSAVPWSQKMRTGNIEKNAASNHCEVSMEICAPALSKCDWFQWYILFLRIKTGVDKKKSSALFKMLMRQRKSQWKRHLVGRGSAFASNFAKDLSSAHMSPRHSWQLCFYIVMFDQTPLLPTLCRRVDICFRYLEAVVFADSSAST